MYGKYSAIYAPQAQTAHYVNEEAFCPTLSEDKDSRILKECYPLFPTRFAKEGNLTGNLQIRHHTPSSKVLYMASFYNLKIRSIDGNMIDFSEFQGKVVLITNSSGRGCNSQYGDLESLYRKHGPNGFVILACPCNQFGGQEPGTDSEVSDFVHTKFKVSFPMTTKVNVVGSRMHPVFTYLVQRTGGEPVEWNFVKFLVSRDGLRLERFGPKIHPKEMEGSIQRFLFGE
ncbi:hypothetical protein HDU79_005002 [Rhizoclosmatium sp. JEL0117]|nr:hypothetical protein HDU79_005002 [Rhizoclosmatium sp. JEL0117]